VLPIVGLHQANSARVRISKMTHLGHYEQRVIHSLEQTWVHCPLHATPSGRLRTEWPKRMAM
jgi:hypothetical protein